MSAQVGGIIFWRNSVPRRALSHFLVKPVTLYNAKIESSLSKSAHIFGLDG